MEKYGLLEEHEMDSIIADSNEKTVYIPQLVAFKAHSSSISLANSSLLYSPKPPKYFDIFRKLFS